MGGGGRVRNRARIIVDLQVRVSGLGFYRRLCLPQGCACHKVGRTLMRKPLKEDPNPCSEVFVGTSNSSNSASDVSNNPRNCSAMTTRRHLLKLARTGAVMVFKEDSTILFTWAGSGLAFGIETWLEFKFKFKFKFRLELHIPQAAKF